MPRVPAAAESLPKLFGALRSPIQISGCGRVKRKAWGRKGSRPYRGAGRGRELRLGEHSARVPEGRDSHRGVSGSFRNAGFC